MGSKTQAVVAPGIHRLTNSSFRVRVAVGDRKRGGQQKETTFSAGTGLREMKAWQTKERAAMLRQGLVPVRGTLEGDIPNYLARVKRKLAHPDDRRSEINAWVQRFGSRRRHTITRDEIRGQVKDWIASGVGASTVRHRLTALSTLYDELDGEDAYNPVRSVKRPKEPDPAPDGLPPQTIDAVLNALAMRVHRNSRGAKTLARARVLAHTGMRPSQLMRLDIATHVAPYLDQDVPCVFVPAGKGGKPHWKPLTGEGVEALRSFIGTSAAGNFSTSSFYKSWMLACDDAKVERFNPYKLRHSYATLLRSGGTDIADIQELLGHKSPKTTQRYAMVVPEKLVAATRRMESVWAKARGQVAGASPQPTEKKTASQK